MIGRDPNLIISLEANSNGVIDPMTPKPMIVPQAAKETPRRSMYSGTQATEESAAWPMNMKVSSIAICALRSLSAPKRCTLYSPFETESISGLSKSLIRSRPSTSPRARSLASILNQSCQLT